MDSDDEGQHVRLHARNKLRDEVYDDADESEGKRNASMLAKRARPGKTHTISSDKFSKLLQWMQERDNGNEDDKDDESTRMRHERENSPERHEERLRRLASKSAFFTSENERPVEHEGGVVFRSRKSAQSTPGLSGSTQSKSGGFLRIVSPETPAGVLRHAAPEKLKALGVFDEVRAMVPCLGQASFEVSKPGKDQAEGKRSAKAEPAKPQIGKRARLSFGNED
eukprot:gnl/MRDRNA2_/MRDRNA2_71740_c0_seq1.p1 gnl/MRDRNA2_/MRDRNA2_71740_c0~~gnl/MRDRNA2_/MRDRNA2_71740_c0_seq1.p1  ORF type:complete len:245 (-),score=49.59 gnl/MRDRNA2_/MRDRNA2_71740_c0_seq1:74-745(-)